MTSGDEPARLSARQENLAAFAGLCLFAVCAVVVTLRPDWLAPLERAVLAAFKADIATGDPIGPDWIEEAARDVTALGSYAILTSLSAIVIGYLAIAGERRAAFGASVAVLGGMAASTLLKMAFERPRPDVTPHAAQVFTASFPSAHAMLSTVVYLTLALLLARYALGRRKAVYAVFVALALAVAVGVSRMYLGVHWPTDIIAGWGAGVAWAFGCAALARMLDSGVVPPTGRD